MIVVKKKKRERNNGATPLFSLFCGIFDMQAHHRRLPLLPAPKKKHRKCNPIVSLTLETHLQLF